MRWNEWGNLENIFRNMFFLNPLTEQNVREMILKRMAQSPTALPNEAYYEIFRYSNGNPRDTLSITQEILLDNRGKEITKDAVTKTIKKAEDNHIKKTTAYTFIKRFLDNGFVKEENGKIVLSGRLYYYFL